MPQIKNWAPSSWVAMEQGCSTKLAAMEVKSSPIFRNGLGFACLGKNEQSKKQSYERVVWYAEKPAIREPPQQKRQHDQFTKNPFARERRGRAEERDALKLVDDVQRQGDNIMLGGCSGGAAVRRVTSKAMVPTDFYAADHIRPERIINRTRQAQKFGTVGSGRIPESTTGAGVFATSIQFQLLG